MSIGQGLQFLGLEFVMHHAAALPEQHVGPGFALDMAAQVTIGRPEDSFAACMQGCDDVLPHR